MKHHKAKAAFNVVLDARRWYDSSCLGYTELTRLMNELNEPKLINQDWSQPRTEIVKRSTMVDWINETRAAVFHLTAGLFIYFIWRLLP